ncbi:MAG TPA: HAD hydrolase family protein [Phycisphaerales bacterium]|nr:HAD hydrolase family protein [Phycisphaerales bacterium]HMP37654.1 HAD hydrolase family protein [Phycisphaerales bacterium]
MQHVRRSTGTPTSPGTPPPCDLIALDLDGTLLDSRGRISQGNVAAIASAEAAGIRVVVATGRSWIESRHALTALDYDRPLIASGGSVLSEARTGTTLLRHAMAESLVMEVVASLRRHDHPALLLKDTPHDADDYVVVGDAPLDPASAWWFETFAIRHRRVARIEDDPHPGDTVRVGVVATGSELRGAVAELRADLGDRVFLQHWSAVTADEPTGSGTHLLEIFNPRVNKWTMVEELCRREGIDPRRTVAIGDGLNDVEMLTHAGLGVAMGNAGAEASAAAGARTGHHDADGVAQAIAELLAGRMAIEGGSAM